MTSDSLNSAVRKVVERFELGRRKSDGERMLPPFWDNVTDPRSIVSAFHRYPGFFQTPYFSLVDGTVRWGDPFLEDLPGEIADDAVEELPALTVEEQNQLGREGIREVAMEYAWSRGFRRP